MSWKPKLLNKKLLRSQDHIGTACEGAVIPSTGSSHSLSLGVVPSRINRIGDRIRDFICKQVNHAVRANVFIRGNSSLAVAGVGICRDRRIANNCDDNGLWNVIESEGEVKPAEVMQPSLARYGQLDVSAEEDGVHCVRI